MVMRISSRPSAGARRVIARFALISLALAAHGCGPSQEGPRESASKPAGDVAPAEPVLPVWEATSSRGTFRVQAIPSVERLQVNEPFDLSFEVQDADGAPLAVDDVTVDARMPAHRHGMNRDVAVTASDHGHRHVEGLLLHMVGHWEIHFDVTQGARTERAQIDVQLDL